MLLSTVAYPSDAIFARAFSFSGPSASRIVPARAIAASISDIDFIGRKTMNVGPGIPPEIW